MDAAPAALLQPWGAMRVGSQEVDQSILQKIHAMKCGLEGYEASVVKKLEGRKAIALALCCERSIGHSVWKSMTPYAKLRHVEAARRLAPKRSFWQEYDILSPPRRKLRRVETPITPENGCFRRRHNYGEIMVLSGWRETEGH